MSLTPTEKLQAAVILEPDFKGSSDDLPWTDAELEAAYAQVAINNARTAAYERAKAKHAEALKAVKDRYPQTEIDGWSELVSDAKEGSGACIEAYAASMGIPVADACQRILTVREGYRAAYGDATGELTKTRDMIDQAQTVEDLEAINWPETKP